MPRRSVSSRRPPAPPASRTSPSSSSRSRPRSTMSRASRPRRSRWWPTSAAARRTSRSCGSRRSVRDRAIGARTFSALPACISAARISTGSWAWRRVMPALGLRSPLLRKGLDAPSWYFFDLATWHRIGFLYDPKVLTEVRARAAGVRGAGKDRAAAARARAAQGPRAAGERRNRQDRAVERRSSPRSISTRASPTSRCNITRAELEAAVADSLQRIRSRIDERAADGRSDAGRDFGRVSSPAAPP